MKPPSPTFDGRVVVSLTPTESEAFAERWRARLQAQAKNIGRKAIEAAEAAKRGEP